MLEPPHLSEIDSELYSGRAGGSSAYFNEDTGLSNTSSCSFIGGFTPFDDLIFIDNNVFTGGGPSGPPGPAGPPGPQGPPGTPGLVPVTDVTTTPYNVVLTDYMVAVNVPSASSIILPASPIGTVFIIKDASGDASTNPITITASTTIDGEATAVINADYGSLTFVFNGTEWNLV